MGGSHRWHCSEVPCADKVGPTRLMPIRPTSSGARGNPAPARGGNRALPLTTKGDGLVEVGKAGGQPDAVLPREIVPQPLMKPGSQLLLFGRDLQVHVGKVWHMGTGPSHWRSPSGSSG